MPNEQERPRFLTDLLAEVDAFDAELFPSKDPVSSETKDVVVGTLSPWLRKAYAFGRYYYRQMNLLAVEREYETVESVSGDIEIATMKYKYDALMELMWGAVRDEHNLFTAQSVGIRVNWQVVTSEPGSTTPEFAEFLAMLMGRRKK